MATHQYLPHISISLVTPAGPIVAQIKLPVIQQPWKMALGAPWIDDLPSGKLTISY